MKKAALILAVLLGILEIGLAVMPLGALAAGAAASAEGAPAAESAAGYTVRFAMDGREYILPGDSSAPLSEILAALDLPGTAEAVSVSDASLFSASDETGEWVVTARRAFDSKEWMRVRAGGDEYTITVTDDTTLVYYDPADSKEPIKTKSVYNTIEEIGDDSDTDYKWESRAGITSSFYVCKRDYTIGNRVRVKGDIQLLICDGVTLTCSRGITVAQGSTLTIYGGTTEENYKNNGKTIKGNGILMANSGAGAAIGGGGVTGYSTTAGTILIKGCDIRAISNNSISSGAGIGGAPGGTGGTIVIYGGKINALGGKKSAGIGGGENCSGGSITVYGGEITASGREGGAGIGGGSSGSGGNTIIYSGKITASGEKGGAGIGGGNGGTGGTINIYGGTITEATGNDGGAGIGSGNGANGGEINIHGGTITKAVGNLGGAGIGGGKGGNGGTINIDDGTIVEANSVYGAGIGGGSEGGSGGDITIRGGTISANGGNSAGIGGGDGGSSGTITISNANVEAISIVGAAIGSGSSYDGDNGTIVIYSGNITAKNKSQGAGIGSGCYCNGNGVHITIHGGTVTAIGGKVRGAGIGGGGGSKGGNITIYGGVITAYTNEDTGEGAGIGGGGSLPGNELFDDGGTITIAGGVVTATGGNEGGAGIGGGVGAEYGGGQGGNVTISGGVITATGGVPYAMGIGGGKIRSMNKCAGGGTLKLSYTPETQGTISVTADSYSGSVSVVDGCAFHDGCGNTYMGQLSAAQVNEMGGRVIRNNIGTSFGYRDENGNMVGPKEATVINGNTTNWDGSVNDGFYVLYGDATLNGPVNVSGNVTLLLCNNFTLNARQGIHVNSGNSLTIYSHSDGNYAGKLVATGTDDQAGIGSDGLHQAGNITIRGGNIEARGGKNAAGIGGGGYGGTMSNNSGRPGGYTVISGGRVAAYGGQNAAGIGGGAKAAGGNITITGRALIQSNPSYGKTSIGAGEGYGEFTRYRTDQFNLITINGGIIDGASRIGGSKDFDYVVLSYEDAASGLPAIKTDQYVANRVMLNKGFADRTGSNKKVFLPVPDPTQMAAADYRQLLENLNGTTLIPSVGYPITTQGSSNCKVTVNQYNAAEAGDRVTVHIDVAEDCTFTSIEVVDDAGRPVAYSGSGVNYTFTMPAMGVNVKVKCRPVNAVPYIDPTQTGSDRIQYCDDFTILKGTLPQNDQKLVVLEAGWYVVRGKVDTNEEGGFNYGRFVCKGEVHLILSDGAEMTALRGITVPDQSSLTIWAQSEGDDKGKLYAGSTAGSTSTPFNCAGIGGEEGDWRAGINESGPITINGGYVKAVGYSFGAGIGGGYRTSCSGVTINGGEIEAIGSYRPGIGDGGGYGRSGNIVINGGKVTATGGSGYGGIDVSVGDSAKPNNNRIIIGSGSEVISVGGGNAKAFGSRIPIEFYANAMVRAGESEEGAQVALCEERQNACRSNSWAHVLPCNQHQLGYMPVSKEQHRYGCMYCAGADVLEDHIFIGVNQICVCGGLPVRYVDPRDMSRREAFCLPASGDMKDGGVSEGWYAVTADMTLDERVAVTGDINLILCDGATLTAKQGITVEGENSLTLWAQRTEDGGTAATRMGALSASTSREKTAAIGGTSDNDAGSIVINGGRVTAQATLRGVGIGGGYGAHCGSVTINGGVVNAKGGQYGAGIGNGVDDRTRPGGSVTINGGSVTATGGPKQSDNNGGGAGIGSSYNGLCPEIKITDGQITATGDLRCAGIGGTYAHNCTTIQIDGGTIRATGGNHAAGIGNGPDGTESPAGSVKITGGEIIASSPWRGAGIGGGTNGKTCEIEITGGTIRATGGQYGAGIGGGSGIAANTITLTGGKIEATGNGGGAGIGSGGEYTGTDGVLRLDLTGADPDAYVTANSYNCTVDVADESGNPVFVKAIETGDIYTGRVADNGAIAQKTLVFVEAYTISIDTNITGGTVTAPEGEEAGNTVQLTVTPKDSSYTLQTLTVIDADGDVEVDMENFTFTMPAKDVTVSATFVHTPITYYDPLTKETVTLDELYTPVTGETTAWAAGWYAVTADVRISSRVSVTGNVNLILCDGATLTAPKGIEVNDGKKLTIYAQSEGDDMGALDVEITDENYQYGAAIGGNEDTDITICGGRITAKAYDKGESCPSAGIGGGWYDAGGNITIYGGVIVATGGNWGAGIGGGIQGAGGNITITGGKIEAESDEGAGIGGGRDKPGGNITITGGDIEAKSTYGAGIGGGHNGAGGTITIAGGTVVAKSSGGADIGGGYKGAGGAITITGGMIEATNNGVGIGDGDDYTGTPGTLRIDLSGAADGDYVQASSRHGDAYGCTVNVAKADGTPVWVKDEDGNYYTGQYEKGAMHAADGKMLVKSGPPPVKYLNAEGDEATCAGGDYTMVGANTKEWGSGWYAVTKSVTISDRVQVNGDVHLILCDGATLTAEKGIHLPSGRSLTVYAQSTGDDMGGLVAKNSDANNYDAAIGGDGYYTLSKEGEACGAFTVYGGNISVSALNRTVGIGGGGSNKKNAGAGGAITINGGAVSVSVPNNAVSIGGGYSEKGACGAGGTVIVNGGALTVRRGLTGAGGQSSSGYGGPGKVDINGGTVYLAQVDSRRSIVTLAWTEETREGMSFTANSYTGIVKLDSAFKTETNNVKEFFPVKANTNLSRYGGKTLVPAVPYAIEVEVAELSAGITGGTVTAPAYAEEGDTVALTVTPKDSSYELNAITYTYTPEGGTETETPIDVIEGKGGFTMPAKDVKVSAAFKQKPIEYYDPEEDEIVTLTEPYTVVVTGQTASWKDGWYAVTEDASIDSRVEVEGDVKLILCDGKTLTAPRGIHVPSGVKFTVYGRSDDPNEMGALTIDSHSGSNAGIGGNDSVDSVAGTITISGGKLTVTGGAYSAGIGGGGESGCGGTIIINSGSVTAFGYGGGAGIGGGSYASGGTIIINGGNIEATGDGGAGIGNGTDSMNGSGNITINGGTIKADSNIGTGIGGGWKSASGNITITGGKIEASSKKGVGIGDGSEYNSSPISALRLDLSNATDGDYVKAESYNCAVNVADENGNPVYVKATETGDIFTGRVADNSAIAGKKLVNHVPTPWQKLQAAIGAAGTAETTIKVSDYATNGVLTAGDDDEALTVADGQKITLDLDGCVLDRGLAGKSAVDGGNIITVNGTLTVTDSKPDTAHTPAITYTDPISGDDVTVTGGVITGGNSEIAGGGVYVNSGTFTLNGGTICGNTASDNGGGVYMSGGGTFTLNGGAVSGNTAYLGGGVYVKGGTFTLEDGGAVEGNGANLGGGVYVDGGTFNMNGDILENTAKEGCGAYVDGGKLTMTGGSIRSNTGDALTPGGGIHATNGAAVVVEGGSIYDNEASFGGGAYVINGATLTLKAGGAITGNTAACDGGGVNVAGGGSAFELAGGTVTDNQTTDGDCNGGGVFVSFDSAFKMSGAAHVTGNTRSGSTNNVYLAKKDADVAMIEVTDALNGAAIGVTMQAPGVFTTGLSGKGDDSNFTSDNAGYGVRLTTAKEATLVPLTQSTVEVVFDDAGDQDGKRPTSVDVVLNDGQNDVASVTLNENECWTATVGNLPAKDADGDEIAYSWVLDENILPEGYTLTDTEVSGTVMTLTVSYTPEETEMEIHVIWNDENDQDGKRPDSLTAELLGDGITKDTVTLSKSNEWKTTVSNLPKYAGGEAINYSWAVDTPDNYQSSEEISGTVTKLTFTFSPGKTEATVKAVWADDNNRYGKRPGSLSVALFANGSQYGEPFVLNAGNSWTATTNDLPQKNAGQDVAYTWRVDDPDYYAISQQTSNKVTTLTCTLKQSAVTAPPEPVQNLEYDGTAQALVSAGTATNGTMQYAVGGETSAPTTGWSDGIPERTDADTYHIWYKSSGADGYVDSEPGRVSAAIAPKSAAVTITGANNTTDYDGSAHTVTGYTAEADTDLYDVTKDISFIPAASATLVNGVVAATQTDVGRKAMGLQAGQFENTNGNFDPVSFTVTDGYQEITPKSITGATVTLSDTALDYTGSKQSVTVTGVTLDGKALTADDYTVSGATEGTNAATYTVTVTGKGNYKDTATAKWKINKGTMTVSAPDVTATYDGQAYGIVVEVTTPASGAVVKYGTVQGTYDLDESPTMTDVATEPLTVYYQVTAKNYTTVKGSATVTITPKSITGATVTLSETEKPYTASEQTVTVTGVTLDSKDLTADDYTVSGATSGTDAKTYTVTVTGKGNYKDTATAEWTITPADLTISMTDRTLEYNGGTQSGWSRTDEGKETITGLKNNETLTITYTPASGKAVKTYTNGSYDTTTLQIKDGNTDVTKNYTLKSATAGKLTITRKSVTITAADQEVTFSANGISIPVDGMFTIPNGAGTPTYSVTKGTGEGGFANDKLTVTKCGTFTVKVNTVQTATHKAGEASATLTVNKAPNPATVEDTATVMRGGHTYDLAEKVTLNGATGNVSYAISGEANGCTLNGSVLTSGNTPGSVTVNVTVAEDGNYKALAATPITVTISNKPAQTITASNVTATYGETGKSISALTSGDGQISFTVKSGSENYIDVDDTSGALTIKKVPPTDGKAYVTVTAEETDNYAVATKDVTVTISPASISGAVVTLSATEKPYTASEQSVKVSKVTLDGKELTTDDYTVSGDTKGTDAGTYTITVTGKGNYKDSATATWTIKDGGMDVSAPDVSVTYDGQAHGITVIVNEPQGAVVKYGTVEGTYDQDESPTMTDVADQPLVVYYQVTEENYAPVTGSAKVTIEPKSITGATVQLSATKKPYTASEQRVTVKSVTLNGKKLTTDDYTVSGKTKGTNAGTYRVTVTGQGNYKDTATAAWTITPASISGATVQLSATEKPYTASEQSVTVTGVTLDGKELKENDYTVSGATSGTDAGTYTVTVTGKGNYKGSATATWTITPADLTISMADRTLEYNAGTRVGWKRTNAGKETVTGLKNNETVSITYTPASGVSAGTYTNGAYDTGTLQIKDGDTDVTKNYNLKSATPGKLTITKKAVTITVNDQEYVYDGQPKGEADPAYEDASVIAGKITVDGLKGQDAVASIVLDGQETAVGVYEERIVPSNAAIKNGDDDLTDSYAITYVSGKLTINPKKVTITANSARKDYDGTALTESGFTATALEEGDEHTFDVVMAAESIITNAGTQGNVIAMVDGVTVQTGVETQVGEYLVTTIDGTLTIDPIAVTVTIKGNTATAVYDGQEHTVSGYIAKANNTLYDVEKDFTFSGTGSATQTDVGKKGMGLAKKQFKNINKNFDPVTFKVTDGWQEITPATVTATAKNVKKTYDGQAHGITVNVTKPASGAVVKYGTVQGTYDLDQSPTITDVSSMTVYYQVTADNYTTMTGSAKVTINKAAPKVTAPKALTLTYTGKAQKLLKKGSTKDGTIQYALGENAATAPTSGWSTAIPTGIDEGTYFAWYKVQGDKNHTDTDPVCIEVTIDPPVATTVVWDTEELKTLDLLKGESYSQGGIILKAVNGSIGPDGTGTALKGYGFNDDSFRFLSTWPMVKIEIVGKVHKLEWPGAEQTDDGVVWTGCACSVDFGKHIDRITKITIELDPTKTPEPPAADFVTPKALKEIEAEAFAGIGAMSVRISDGVTSIGSRVFANCPNLRFIAIPDSVQAIPDDLLAGCSDVTVYGSSADAKRFAQANGFVYVKVS